jgi:hypothetical protein
MNQYNASVDANDKNEGLFERLAILKSKYYRNTVCGDHVFDHCVMGNGFINKIIPNPGN